MPDGGSLQDAYRHCDLIARRRAQNFYPAFRFLPRARRLALSAFYAFCSLSDDIADDNTPLTIQQRRENLDAWRVSLRRCFDGNTDSPLFLALNDTVSRFAIPREPMQDLLDGIEMDLEPRRYSTFPELEAYCRKVASSIGRVSIRIFGCTNSGAERYADALGIAFQLTNVLRDVAEDLRRNRLYLPLEDLAAFAYTEADLRKQIHDCRFLELMHFEYSRALEYFEQARPDLAGNQAKKLLAAQIMRGIYRQNLEELRRRDFRVFERRITIPRWRMIAGITRTLFHHVAYL